MGLFSYPTPYRDQKYHELKKQAQESGQLFTDPEFPPNSKSLFHSDSQLSGIEWKRPKDLSSNPQLFVDGVSGHDLNQGEVGNCWFVAACSCLAQEKAIWSKVIPDYHEQEWDPEKPDSYAGIFHFQFWRYGEWIDVVVDDYLPSRNGKLIYVHSKAENEFWSALLEKAYAKIYGNYESLDGGELAEALEDFTGGVSEPIDLHAEKLSEDQNKRDELYKTMKKSFDNKALMAAAIPAKSSEEMEQATETGLVKGHAYGITMVKRVALEGSGLFNMFNREKISMIRLRNPWGGTEWKGAFSDGSPEWDNIDKSSREKIGLTFDDDGEFWMTFEDYCKYFTNMSICRVVNTSFFSTQKTWHESIMSSDWSSPNRAGGCINNKETFLNNPQFLFDVVDGDEDEVLIALTQKSGRDAGESKLTIGFTVVKVEANREMRIHRRQEIVKSSTFKNSRSIFLRHTFPVGRYVVLATTFEPGHSGAFLLRIYSGASNNAKELSKDKPSEMSLSCLPCFSYPTLLTQIRIIKCTGLEHQDTIGGADPYIIISCEGNRVTSPTIKDTLNPEFNYSAVFYRRSPRKKPVKVNIWNANAVKDTHMGRHAFTSTQEVDRQVLEVNLYGRKDQENVTRPGKLFVEITTTQNLSSL